MDDASNQWTGQDWLLIEVDTSPWALPTSYASNGYALLGARWYAGQIAPSGQPTRHRYVFDGNTHELAVQGPDGTIDVLPSSGDRLTQGTYVLAVRLRHNHLQAAVVPVLKVMVAEDGGVSYETNPRHDRASHMWIHVRPRLQNTDSCRRLASAS